MNLAKLKGRLIKYKEKYRYYRLMSVIYRTFIAEATRQIKEIESKVLKGKEDERCDC